jgi:uncharacterized protein
MVLLGALLAGIAVALLAPGRLAVPGVAFTVALAAAGVVLGTMLDREWLDAIVAGWLPLALVTLATLGISLGAGALLARATGLDVPTAALGMVAGGAAGIVGVSHEFGADDRLVAFMQYLRVLLIVLLTPIVVAIAFPGGEGAAAAAGVGYGGDAHGWLLLAATTAAGIALARVARFPGATLLLPLGAAAVVTLAVPGGEFDVPPVARDAAFALIGLQVGLKFTLETIRVMGRLLLPALVAIAGVLGACGLLAVGLELTTSVSLRDAYLATTPGGLYAVLAVAIGTDANAGFILAAQGLRLVVMVAVAPIAVRWLVAHVRSVQHPA